MDAARRVSLELIEAAQTPVEDLVFRRFVLEHLGRTLPFDSAIFLEGATPPACVNKEQFLPLHREVYRDYRRFSGALDHINAALRHCPVQLDNQLFTRRQRERLPFYAEVLAPQKITSQLIAHVSFRGQRLGLVYLCRHGSSRPHREDERRLLRRILPAVGVAAAAVRSAGANDSELSPRERDVTRLVCRGLGNREIADLLGTSPHTVRNQLHAIFEKLGVANRAELAAWAARSAP